MSNRGRSKRKGALLKANKSASQPSSPASQSRVEVNETKTFTPQMDSSVQLPFVLSAEEQSIIQTLRTPTELLVLCKSSKPTASLDILWLGSMNLSRVEGIELLKVSGEYDHGDSRYLKRNWLRLAMLLRESGDPNLAGYYEQLASVLP